MRVCEYATENGQCPQPASGRHCYYHQKVLKRLLEETEEYLSETEIDQMFGGRRRNDGRRLDQFTKL